MRRFGIAAKLYLAFGGLFVLAIIASIVGCSTSTVGAIVKSHEADQDAISGKRGNCRRHRVTTPRDDRQIVSEAISNRKATALQLKKGLENKGIAVSTRTIKRRLAERGIRARKPRRKPLLTPAMKMKRRNWAKQHKSWTQNDWDKVKLSRFGFTTTTASVI